MIIASGLHVWHGTKEALRNVARSVAAPNVALLYVYYTHLPDVLVVSPAELDFTTRTLLGVPSASFLGLHEDGRWYYVGGVTHGPRMSGGENLQQIPKDGTFILEKGEQVLQPVEPRFVEVAGRPVDLIALKAFGKEKYPYPQWEEEKKDE